MGGGGNFKIILASWPSISLLKLFFMKGVGSLLLCEYLVCFLEFLFFFIEIEYHVLIDGNFCFIYTQSTWKEKPSNVHKHAYPVWSLIEWLFFTELLKVYMLLWYGKVVCFIGAFFMNVGQFFFAVVKKLCYCPSCQREKSKG